jgi:hypothetical protein
MVLFVDPESGDCEKGPSQDQRSGSLTLAPAEFASTEAFQARVVKS